MLIFNDKQQSFVNILLHADEPINNTQMQKLLHSSKRTVYNIVNKVNEELLNQSFEPVHNQRGKGYYFTKEQKESIQRALNVTHISFLSPKYQASYIACWLLYPKQVVHLNDLMCILDVSRNTIFNDLKKVKEILLPYDISLEFDIKQGYTTHGTTLHKHSFLMNYM